MTARPPTIPTMLKVAPTAALLLKKPEVAPPLGVAPMEMVEPGLVEREPDNPDVYETGLLTNVVVGLWAILDVAPTDELVTPREEDDWAFEEEDDDGEGVDDGEGEAEVEAALVPGEVDVAGDDEGVNELSCVGEEEEGEGEEDAAGLDACVFASGVEGVDCEGVGLDWGELDSEAGTDVVALAWWRARRW